MTDDAERTHLQIVVHDNGEVTTRDERGMPVVCKDCRFSGWLTQLHFEAFHYPSHCLVYSGGANPRTGLRIFEVAFIGTYNSEQLEEQKSKQYPKCINKNRDGMCKDFVPAKKLPWWKRWFRSRRTIRE